MIALASVIQEKELTSTWSNDKGHMEFNPKLAQKMKGKSRSVCIPKSNTLVISNDRLAI